MALTFIAKEAIWQKGLLSDFGLDQNSVDIHYDNQGVIYLAYNPAYHKRTKHIDIRYHFIRDILANGVIVVKKIMTEKNPADMMTKPVPLAKLKLYLSTIGVCGE